MLKEYDMSSGDQFFFFYKLPNFQCFLIAGYTISLCFIIFFIYFFIWPYLLYNFQLWIFNDLWKICFREVQGAMKFSLSHIWLEFLVTSWIGT